MKEILKFENVCFRYDREREALKKISVRLYEKERVAVLGNNGAGKSTFFLCCNGILKPQSGELHLEENLVKYTRKELGALRQSIGLIFQDPDSQIIAGTVEAEVSFGPMNLKLTREQVLSRVDEALEKMHLEGFRHRAPHYLSGGERKRVSIADVLAMDPKLMLFDEPTASLDPENTRLLEENLEKLSQSGLGLVISTHDVDFAWRWAERLLVFHDGELVADGAPEIIFSNDKLLKVCGLVKPTLFEIGKIYHMSPLPKKISDIREI